MDDTMNDLGMPTSGVADMNNLDALLMPPGKLSRAEMDLVSLLTVAHQRFSELPINTTIGGAQSAVQAFATGVGTLQRIVFARLAERMYAEPGEVPANLHDAFCDRCVPLPTGGFQCPGTKSESCGRPSGGQAISQADPLTQAGQLLGDDADPLAGVGALIAKPWEPQLDWRPVGDGSDELASVAGRYVLARWPGIDIEVKLVGPAGEIVSVPAIFARRLVVSSGRAIWLRDTDGLEFQVTEWADVPPGPRYEDAPEAAAAEPSA